jgi:hypothetical protein
MRETGCDALATRLKERSTHKVSGSRSQRERLQKRVGREWATSVSKRDDARCKNQRTPYHLLDFLGVGVAIVFFIAGAPFSVFFLSYRLLGGSLLL